MRNEKIQIIRDNTRLLNIIRCYNSVDRNILCSEMKLSWPTLQKNIDLLKKIDVIKGGIKKNDSQEGKKEEYAIHSKAGYYIGISVGGSQIKVCITDMTFRILSREFLFNELINKFQLFADPSFQIQRCREESPYGYFYLMTPTDFGQLQSILNYILNEIIKLNEKFRDSGELILGIGFAFTGAVDNIRKEIIKAYSLDCFQTLPIRYDSLIYPEKLSYFSANNISIAFDNIVKAAIVSEKYALYNSENPNTVYRDRKNIGCIYLGSGIGSSFILNNELYRGTSNFSEIGHIYVTDPVDLLGKTKSNITETCSCGGTNCLEHKIRTNVFEMTRADFRCYSASELKQKFLEKDDKDVRLQILAYYINQGIKIITDILNLDLVILTGKLTHFMDELNAPLYREKANNMITYTNRDCSLVTSTYGALAPAAGAAILSAFDETVPEIRWY